MNIPVFSLNLDIFSDERNKKPFSCFRLDEVGYYSYDDVNFTNCSSSSWNILKACFKIWLTTPGYPNE